MRSGPAWHGVDHCWVLVTRACPAFSHVIRCPPVLPPLLQIRKQSLREAKYFAQDYLVHKL